MKNSSVVLVFLLLFALCDISAQQAFSGVEQSPKSKSGMITPFSTQTPTDVYQQRHIQRSNINVEYHRRDNVSRPVAGNYDIVTGLQNQRVDNKLTIGSSSVGSYTQTPKMVNDAVAEKVTSNSFPMIDSKGNVIDEVSEEGVVETNGMAKVFPDDWGQPGPIGDIAFPMLLLAGAYLLVRSVKNIIK